MHQVQNRRDSFRARDFFVLGWKGPKIAKLLLQNLQVVFFMAIRNCARPEQVEVTPIYKANQLRRNKL